MKVFFAIILLFYTTIGQAQQFIINSDITYPVNLAEEVFEYDSDAQAFFTATGITDSTIKTAINSYVLREKTSGNWERAAALYPIVGGTESTHKWNLKDPRDLDAAYRLTFAGTVTHSSTGMTGNGSTGAANTFLNANTVYPTTGLMSMGVYLRTNSAGTVSDMGAISGSTNYLQIYANFGSTFYGQANNVNISQSVANTDSRGWFFVCRTGATNMFIQKNATQTVFSGATHSLGIVNNNIRIMAQTNTSGDASLFSARQVAFAGIWSTMTQTQATDEYNSIQQLQTDLSRQL